MDELETLVSTAGRLAAFQHRLAITSEYLLLAIMRDEASRWSRLLSARGVGTYEAAQVSLGPLPILTATRDQRSTTPRSMRRLLVDRIIWSWRWLRQALFGAEQGSVERELPLAPDARLILEIARTLAQDRPNSGHVLVALASVPGPQMKLLRREYRVVAAATRRELGLVRLSDRLTLAVHAPPLILRRIAAHLKQGRRAKQALYYILRALGVVWAFFVFGVEALGTLVLYIFIWPAVLLANGIRLLVARLTKVTFKVRRGHEIPGGELEVDPESSATDTAVALTVLLPRAVCFGVSVLSFLILEWGTRTLGVNPFPAITARSDLLAGRSGPLAAPLLILVDAIGQHGLFAGVGWLAGICAGLLAVPSVREIQMIRLSGGHDVGLGTRGLRIAASPLAAITFVLAAVESVLPFRGGPLYVTIYILPVALAILAADILRLLLPY